MGKTTLALNLSIALGQLGNRVCLLDADTGSTNINDLLGSDHAISLADVLTGDNSLDEITYKGPGDIDIIPAGKGVEELTGASNNDHSSLIEKFDSLGGYDMIIVDTSSGIGSSNMPFVRAADIVVAILTPDSIAVNEGLSILKILHVNQYSGEMFILPNMFKSTDQVEHVVNKILDITKSSFDGELNILPPIMNDPDIDKSVLIQEPVVIRDPESLNAREIKGVANQMRNLASLVSGMGAGSYIHRVSSFAADKDLTRLVQKYLDKKARATAAKKGDEKTEESPRAVENEPAVGEVQKEEPQATPTGNMSTLARVNSADPIATTVENSRVVELLEKIAESLEQNARLNVKVDDAISTGVRISEKTAPQEEAVSDEATAAVMSEEEEELALAARLDTAVTEVVNIEEEEAPAPEMSIEEEEAPAPEMSIEEEEEPQEEEPEQNEAVPDEATAPVASVQENQAMQGVTNEEQNLVIVELLEKIVDSLEKNTEMNVKLEIGMENLSREIAKRDLAPKKAPAPIRKPAPERPKKPQHPLADIELDYAPEEGIQLDYASADAASADDTSFLMEVTEYSIPGSSEEMTPFPIGVAEIKENNVVNEIIRRHDPQKFNSLTDEELRIADSLLRSNAITEDMFCKFAELRFKYETEGKDYLGKILLERDLITTDIIKEFLALNNKGYKKFCFVLRDQGLINKNQFQEIMADKKSEEDIIAVIDDHNVMSKDDFMKLFNSVSNSPKFGQWLVHNEYVDKHYIDDALKEQGAHSFEEYLLYNNLVGKDVIESLRYRMGLN